MEQEYTVMTNEAQNREGKKAKCIPVSWNKHLLDDG